jgi:hypothetical protein
MVSGNAPCSRSSFAIVSSALRGSISMMQNVPSGTMATLASDRPHTIAGWSGSVDFLFGYWKCMPACHALNDGKSALACQRTFERWRQRTRHCLPPSMG